MIKQPHRLRNRVAGAGKAARNRNARAVKGYTTRESKTLEEAMEIARSLGRKFKYPTANGSVAQTFEYWLNTRMHRDAKRFFTFSFGKMNDSTIEVTIRREKRGLG